MSHGRQGKNLLAEYGARTQEDSELDRERELEQLQADENSAPLQEGTFDEKFAAMSQRRNRRLSTPELRRSPTRGRILDGYMDVFEMIGGTTRFAVWADEHPTEFYRQFSKLLPSTSHSLTEHTGSIQIVSAIPESPLDEDVQDAEFTELPNDPDAAH